MQIAVTMSKYVYEMLQARQDDDCGTGSSGREQAADWLPRQGSRTDRSDPHTLFGPRPPFLYSWAEGSGGKWGAAAAERMTDLPGGSIE